MVGLAQAGRRSMTQSATVQSIAFDAPWSWLAAGWRDLWAAPVVSFSYGAAFAGLAAMLTIGLFRFGLEALILPLSGGFLLIGPVVAVGLYETSRRLEAGEPVGLIDITRTALRRAGRLSFFAAILGFVYIAWLQLAFLLLMLFLGTNQFPPAKDFLPTLLFTSNGLGLLVAGTCVGGALALSVFSISAVSVPLLMVRKVDAVTAAVTSVAAVTNNAKPMLLWAALIAGFMAVGLATLFVGLVVVFPLIGYATWHAFHDLVPDETTGYL
jgi:uncharacterized membrane protein